MIDMTNTIPDFSQTLENNNLKFLRDKTTTLQVNTGLLCNQTCKHCHLDAGPRRNEIMNRTTIDQVISFQQKHRFQAFDITGGAPELNPNILYLVRNISKICKKVMFRSNLSALYESDNDALLDTLIENNVIIVSSFPSLNQLQTDAQRGDGIFDKTIKALQLLNKKGYGRSETGLELNLVSNPCGAFMPASQKDVEKRYRQVLLKKWDIVFNNAFTFANMPLGRFKTWLKKTGNYDNYLLTLYKNFNACTVTGLMCRTLISVSWDGYLYDCDFNLAADLPKDGRKIHIADVLADSFLNSKIMISNHCYACTAGTGFT
ncbi:MAG: radical SAM/Cys-rich domain protein [Desulfobacteraceae bacterium]|nr:radical SAM/Cys-rich domain protein [Desulfobacteraceae bacterium]